MEVKTEIVSITFRGTYDIGSCVSYPSKIRDQKLLCYLRNSANIDQQKESNNIGNSKCQDESEYEKWFFEKYIDLKRENCIPNY